MRRFFVLNARLECAGFFPQYARCFLNARPSLLFNRGFDACSTSSLRLNARPTNRASARNQPRIQTQSRCIQDARDANSARIQLGCIQERGPSFRTFKKFFSQTILVDVG